MCVTIPRERLIKAARQAAQHAYSPYSRLRVGAAVWADRSIYCGCNVENGSYGLTLCAERVAILKSVSEGRHRIDAICVAGSTTEDNKTPSPLMPCGACLQVMAEFGGADLLVIVDHSKEYRLQDLLPHPFTL